MWEQELDERKVSEFYVLNYEKLRTGNTEWGGWRDVAQKQWQWNLPQNTLLVWDEVQKAKGMNTKNARMLWSAKPYRNLMLSATAAKDPTEMKALGFVLGLHRLRDFWKWSIRHGCCPGTFGGLEFSGELEDIDKINKAIFPERGSRLTRRDLAEHFQETKIVMTPLDFGDEVRELYKQMERELAVLATQKASDSKGAEALTIRLRTRQKVELLKVPEIVDRVEDYYAEGLSIAIFVNFSATIDALQKRIKYPCSFISGKHGDREKNKWWFQQDINRIIICNVQAGGVSINLHDTKGDHPRVSLISPSDNEKDILQVLGRIDRAGGATPTQQYILFAAGTVEDQVKDNCVNKMGLIDIFNEGLDVTTEK